MLEREGYGYAGAKASYLAAGAFLEWMDEPNLRYQLLAPGPDARSG